MGFCGIDSQLPMFRKRYSMVRGDAMSHLFVSYVREDSATVARLVETLSSFGITRLFFWPELSDRIGSEFWAKAVPKIRAAVRQTAAVFFMMWFSLLLRLSSSSWCRFWLHKRGRKNCLAYCFSYTSLALVGFP
jgi:hypothetical protein